MTASKTAVSPARLLAALACATVLLAGVFAAGAGPGTATASNVGGPIKAPMAKPKKPAKSGVLRGNPSNYKLATIFLSLLKAKDTPGLNRLLDPAFLLQRGQGDYLTKKEYLANPSVVEDFSVSNIVVTTNALKTVKVVRFDAQNIQTIDGVPVPATPIPRLSTFAKNKNGVWRLIAHANFVAPPTT